MKILCSECKKSFNLVNRGSTNKYIPPVCSPKCFIAMLKDIDNSYLYDPMEDYRVSKCEFKMHNFRSSYESKFAKWADKNKLKWDYEPWTFKLSSGKTYSPDFYMPDFKVFIEVKGLWESGAKSKVKAFQAEFPFLIYVIDYEALKLLIK